MKTETTLRMARNSLLCFFMALAAGLLAACGGGGGGDVGGGGGNGNTFLAYLVDAPVEGATYSGPTRPVPDETGENGVFMASEGVFEFSVGATTLGSVRLNSDWAKSQVTPADFMDVDEARVIDIARILQGLDGDKNPRNGISIPQTARDQLTVDLFADTVVIASLAADPEFVFEPNGINLTIPEEGVASAHLIATRQCLFSGGYAGSYRSTVTSDSPAEGEAYFVLEPFASRTTGVEKRRNGQVDILGFLPDLPDVGVIGNVIALDSRPNGFTLTFVTPRLVNGIWTNRDASGSGIYRLTRIAGDPTAVGRVVGTEYESSGDTQTTVGLYVLDYFTGDNGGFRGQYYDVTTGQFSALDLTIAGGAWPTEVAAATMALTLSGTRGGDNTTVTMGVIRVSGNHGTFEGAASDSDALEGTWCDLVRSTEVAVSGGVLVESLAMSHSRIGGDVSAHRLSRYLDSGFPANTAIDGVQILG